MNPLTIVVDGIKEMLDTWKDLKQEFNDKVFARKMDSVAKRARRSILYFPVVVSENISPEFATTLVKYIQVLMADYVKIFISSKDIIEIESSKKGDDKLDYIEDMRGMTIDFKEHADVIKNHIEKNLSVIIEQGISLFEDEIPNPIEKHIFHEIFATDVKKNTASFSNLGVVDPKKYEDLKDKTKQLAKDKYELKKQLEDEKKKPKQGMSIETINDVEVKKINNMTPLLLNLKTLYKTGDRLTEANIVLGVKAVLHPVPSQDLIEGIDNAITKKNFVLNFLKMTSGEITFLKDWLFGINDITASIMVREKEGTRIFKSLERQVRQNLKARTKFGSIIGNKYVPPTATVVLTDDEVVLLKKHFNIDLKRPAQVKKFLENSNLIGIKIIDESVGLVESWDDGAEEFDRISLKEMKSASSSEVASNLLSILANK